MTTDKELNDLIEALIKKSMQLTADFQENPPSITALVQQFIELTEQIHQLMLAIQNNPEKVWQRQFDYWHDTMALAQNHLHHWLEGKAMPIADQRFREEAWLNNPFFNLLSQHYILASKHITILLEQLDYEDRGTAKRLQFFIKQYLDALSPTNFMHTNPQVLRETIESRGKNLLQGLYNLLSDLKAGSSQIMIKMTDMNAFTLGNNLACTPGKVIFRNEMMELIHYAPTTAKVKTIPLLMIPPWINKYYILDLSPHNSLVKWLVAQGISVFIISWVNPDARFAQKSLFDYLEEGPRTAIRIIQQQLAIHQVNTLGFCIGGTLLSLMLAYNKALGDNSIHSATFLAAMIDFSDPGDIAVFIDEQQIQKIEAHMSATGYLAGEFMASSFNSLRANDLVWSFFIKNYLQGKNAVPFDILYWNSDSTNMPATMHSQYLRWMYLQNDLVKPNKIRLNEVPLDVSSISIPTFFLSTEKDHIAPWKTTYLGFQLMKGPKRFVLGGSGHIAGIINAVGSSKYGYRTNDENSEDAKGWLKSSVEHSGSWWPEWLGWLKKHSGPWSAAPDISRLTYPGLIDAPGDYVLKKNNVNGVFGEVARTSECVMRDSKSMQQRRLGRRT